MPIGSFAEPKSFLSATFYKGLALTVRLIFILAGPFAKQCMDFHWVSRKLGTDFLAGTFLVAPPTQALVMLYERPQADQSEMLREFKTQRFLCVCCFR